jgi:hypothetical protein
MFQVFGFMQLIRKFLMPRDGLFFVIAAVLVIVYVVAAGGHGFPLDDSWIHQVYGRNLAQRGEWAFIPGQPSAASTSPLYTVLLAAGYFLNLPYLLWTHFLGVIALMITAMLGARMAAHLLPKQRHIGLVTGLALLLAWHLVWAAVSGMETMIFAMMTLALLALAWREVADDLQPPTLARGFIFGVVSGLATLTRPEGMLLAGLVGLTLLITRPRRAIQWGVAAAFGFGLTLLPYLLFNLQVTGGLLPDTAAAKQAQVAPILAAFTYPQRVEDMVKPLIAGGQLLLLPGILYYGFMIASRVRLHRMPLFYALLLLWPLALTLLYAARLPAPYQHGRYLIPTLPALIVAGVVGMGGLIELGRRTVAGRVFTRSFAGAAVAVFIYFVVVIGPREYAKDVRIVEEEMVTTAQWIDANIPPDELLAIHDIGAVGYFTPRPLLDIAGLVNPEVIPIIVNENALWAMMQAHDARYLMAFPNQVPGGDIGDEHLCPVFTTGNETARAAGGENMSVYALTWNGQCP